MSDCIFCKIIQGQLASKKVHEDELCIAFDDVNPQSPVHTLVVPKQHVASLEGFQPKDQSLLGHLVNVCRSVAKQKGIAESGYRIVINTGAQSGQTVFHVHFHVLGGRAMRWPPG